MRMNNSVDPFNLAMLIFLIAALLWPDINYWARSFTALFTTIIAMVIAYSWKREPWPWIPLIPFTVLPYVLFEATAFTDVWLVTFLAVFSLALGRSVEEINGIPFENFIAPGLIMMTILQDSFCIIEVSTNLVVILFQQSSSVTHESPPPLRFSI